MPKKRAPKYDTKPSTPTHPSLSTSKLKGGPHSLGASITSTGNSVNDQIQQLRISQRPSAGQNGRTVSDVLNAGANPSLPPSLRSILQLPDAPAPRPRPNLRIAGGRLRVPAGPAAPASWTRRNAERAREHRARVPATREGKYIQHELLPDSYLPESGSLIATALIAIAKDWEWHKEYDQYYLALIPVRYKEALLHYIALHSPHGIDLAGLNVLFLDSSELEDATGAEGLTHLNLSTSIGQPVRFSHLRTLFSTPERTASSDQNAESVLESWDDTPFSEPLRQPSALGRFNSLTHLSLAHPHLGATWKGLLEIAPLLATITHLSLAHWPTPTLSPNALTAYRETPSGNVSYGASSYYSALDNDYSEAASILRRLSKSLYCLQYLDLTGCHPWIRALAEPQIDWCGSWRALETVKVGQGWMPDCFQAGADKTLWRDIINSNAPGPIGEATVSSADELSSWSTIETISLVTERTANARISAAANVNPLTEDQEIVLNDALEAVTRANSNWNQGSFVPLTNATSRTGIRTSRVRFERGWEEWWIRDAIEAIAVRNPPR